MSSRSPLNGMPGSQAQLAHNAQSLSLYKHTTLIFVSLPDSVLKTVDNRGYIHPEAQRALTASQHVAQGHLHLRARPLHR